MTHNFLAYKILDTLPLSTAEEGGVKSALRSTKQHTYTVRWRLDLEN